MVWRGRDEPNAGCCMACTRDPGIDLSRRKLAALPRLCALSKLDLQIVCVREIHARHAEASGGDLFDRASPLGVEQAISILTAFTCVGLPTETIHRDRECLVGLARDRAIAHRARGEALHDLRHGLHLIDRNGLTLRCPEREESSKRHQPLRLVIHEICVAAEDVVLPGAGCMLQTEDGVWIEEMRRAVATPLVLPSVLKSLMPARGRVGGKRGCMTCEVLRLDDVKTDAPESGDGSGEVRVDELLTEPHRLESLGPGVRGNGGDAHLRHDLEYAVAEG